MKLWDNHMHCHFSGDSDADPLDMIAEAKAKKLSGITFTDHLDIDYMEEPGLFDLDLSAYEKKMRSLIQENELHSAPGTDPFFILHGIELGLQPHLADRHTSLLQQYAFDYIIGSVHVVKKRDPYYPAFFKDRSPASAYREYYEEVYENLKAFCDFDALGHLDYVFRYGPHDKANIDSYAGYADIVDEILRFLIRYDIALEVNTGASRYGMKEPNPCRHILRRYHELGGKLLTLGADAHKPSDIARGFNRLPEFLSSCGFHEYMVYRNRVPHPHSLM